MDPIEIPVATLWGKMLVGPCCLLVGLAVLWWTVPKFLVLIRVIAGREPRNPGTKTIHLLIGFAIYGFLFSVAAVAGGIFLDVITTPPTMLSASGITAGGGLVTSRTAIEWEEIERVDCQARRNKTVSQITVRAGDRRVVISSLAIYDLTGVRDVIAQRVPAGVVRPCRVVFRR